jgi:hypothetical protein
VKVVTVGKSAKDRPLQIVQIANALPAASDHRPTVAVVARDYGDNQESGWVAWGMIHFLLSDDPAALEARSRAIFAVMPCIDPDSAAAGKVDGEMVYILNSDNKRPEPRRYAEYFNQQRDSGHPPILAISLRPTEYQIPIQIIEGRTDGLPENARFGEALGTLLQARGLIFDRNRWSGYFYGNGDFAAWFGGHYQATSLSFIVAGQCSAGHLTLGQLQQTGECLVRSANTFLQSPTTQPHGNPGDPDGAGE